MLLSGCIEVYKTTSGNKILYSTNLLRTLNTRKCGFDSTMKESFSNSLPIENPNLGNIQ